MESVAGYFVKVVYRNMEEISLVHSAGKVNHSTLKITKVSTYSDMSTKNEQVLTRDRLPCLTG